MGKDWTRDELVLLCDAVAANGWVAFRAHSEAAEELSEIIRDLSSVPERQRDERFRTAKSIQRKSYDIITARSSYSGTPTRGGALTRQIVAEYDANPARLVAEAKAIRAVAKPAKLDDTLTIDEELDEITAHEGRKRLVAHYRRERNGKLREAKIQSVLAEGGDIACEVCEFDFGATYGEIGEGFIEVHHVLPLHTSGETITRLGDLSLVCSNCHRVIHRSQPWLTPSELRALLQI